MKTRRKLISVIATSCVALCLCLALFAGSTFAWFTDTVVSSGNIITAGKIDIDGKVYYPSEDTGATEITHENQTIYPIITRYNDDSESHDGVSLGDGYYGYGNEDLKFDLTYYGT